MQDHSRRRLLLAGLSGVGAVAVVGGAAACISNARAAGAYESAVLDTWRHSDNFDPPPSDALREIVRYATLAANSHNSQPWRFALSGPTISVTPDFARRLATVDPDNHHLYASIGCATENLVQAAAAFGLHASVHFNAVPGGVSVDLEKSPATKSCLFEAIPRRKSTRSAFDGRAVPAEQLRLLEAAGNGDGVEMRLFTERMQIEEILAYLLAGNSAQMDDSAYIAELTAWLRFNYAEAIATGDGLFSKASGTPTLPSWLGRRIIGFVATKDSENKKYATQLRSSSGVAVFISGENEPESWISAGRCCQRFALQATALGIRHCFINQPVEVPAVRRQFAEYVGAGARRPDLVMRFGYAPELPKSLRRTVGQVLL